MTKIISIVNNKGGVAKTTSTLNIATALSRLGNKVLMIDLDPQSSLSVYYGLEPLDNHNSIYNVLIDEISAEEIICEIEKNLYLIPSGIELSLADLSLINRMSRETILKRKLEPIKDNFDFILIDNSPSLSLLTINSLVASHYIISPSDPTYLAFRGLEILQKVISQVREINKDIELIGVLITMYDSRISHHKQVIKSMKEKYPVFESIIKRSIKFSDSGLNMESIFEYAGDKFEGSESYMNVAKEIIKHG